MEPYYQDKWVTIYHSDCRAVLPSIPDNSVDLLVTDPPYGISFMGKDWDKALPDKKIWSECLRVLKDGAFAFVMSIPRADCLSRMIINLEDAGFQVNFTPIFWAYASGFPKAQNISLSIDKRECLKQLVERLGRKPTKEEFDGAWKEFREVVGESTTLLQQQDHPDSFAGGWKDKSAIGKHMPITLPTIPQAKALDGSYGGFQPKPAVEVIIVAMKPLSEKTFVDQALKNRKGITWLDSARIPYETEGSKATNPSLRDDNWKDYGESPLFARERAIHPFSTSGRFPANLLVSDDVLNDGRITHDKDRVIKHEVCVGAHGIYGEYSPDAPQPTHAIGDSGSFSRYFDLDKWFKTFPFLIVPKASKGEKNKGCGELKGHQHQTGSRTYDDVCANCGKKLVGDVPYRCQCGNKVTQTRITKGNYHPTVKPLKLMSYLITLGSREGDIVLDPFEGSGTTCVAAKNLGRKCIGIDDKEDHCEIAARRCSQEVLDLEYVPPPAEVVEAGKPTMMILLP